MAEYAIAFYTLTFPYSIVVAFQNSLSHPMKDELVSRDAERDLNKLLDLSIQLDN